ncbi:MAG: nuclear transport factor 2 family protein [Holophagaceae bacterium]
MTSANPLPAWHALIEARDPSRLDALLADDAVFHSPVLHAPQRGKPLVKGYLAAAIGILGQASFRYVREIAGPRDAVLEFEVELDGLHVNGVDLIRWNDEGLITDFKVMIRPLKAIQLVQANMAEALARRG